MKQINKLYLLGLIFILSILFCSCNDQENNEIIGTWYGTRMYNNPVGGTKYQYLTVNFGYDKEGSLEYESPTGYTYALFTYSIKGHTIECWGTSANTDGEVTSGFSLTLRIEGERLIPVDQYTQFILTKDNSVITDGNGNEAIYNQNSLLGVWLSNDGYSVYDFGETECTQYTLNGYKSKYYSAMITKPYSYDFVQNTITMGGNRYQISILNENTLAMNESNNYLTFYRGNRSDIPSKGNNADTELLCKPFCWIAGDTGYSNYKKTSESIISLQFYDRNKISMTFSYTTYSSSGIWGSTSTKTIGARGTFSLQGSKLSCNFTDITISAGNAHEYLGWVEGQSKAETYDIQIIDPDNVYITMFNTKYHFEARY